MSRFLLILSFILFAQFSQARSIQTPCSPLLAEREAYKSLKLRLEISTPEHVDVLTNVPWTFYAYHAQAGSRGVVTYDISISNDCQLNGGTVNHWIIALQSNGSDCSVMSSDFAVGDSHELDVCNFEEQQSVPPRFVHKN